MWIYAGWLCALGVVFVPRAGDEREIPTSIGRPLPRLDRVVGLEVEATAELPAWRAGAAEPIEIGAVLAVGGTVSAFSLAEVTVEVEDGLVLTAERGEVRTAELRLFGNVTVERDGTRLLSAAEAVFAGGAVHFPGIVVWRPGLPSSRTEVGVRYPLDRLRGLLR